MRDMYPQLCPQPYSETIFASRDTVRSGKEKLGSKVMTLHFLFSFLRRTKRARIVPIVLAACACSPSGTKHSATESEVETPTYSHLFDTRNTPDGVLVTTYQPADTTKILKRYLLYKGEQAPGDLAKDIVALRIPLENVAAAHATQIGLIDALGYSDRIKSIGSKAALEARSALATRDDLDEFFNGWQFDTEKLLALSPDAVFFSPGRTEDVAMLEKNVRAPLLYDLSPWETHPLARTEWLKFTSEFFDCRQKADSLFAEIEKRYLSVRQQAQEHHSHPKVLSSLPYQGIWYMPAGGSYKGVLFREAALDFPWEDTAETGSLPLDLETVLAKAHDADVWFFEAGMGSCPTLASLKAQNKLYERFKAFRQGDIFVCDTDRAPYFEQSIVHPDWVLSDFTRLPREKDYVPYYYNRIEAR